MNLKVPVKPFLYLLLSCCKVTSAEYVKQKRGCSIEQPLTFHFIKVYFYCLTIRSTTVFSRYFSLTIYTPPARLRRSTVISVLPLPLKSFAHTSCPTEL